MNKQLDFTEIAANALASATSPEALRNIVDPKIEKAVERALDDATRSYSAFGEMLKSAMEDALDKVELNLPSYNTMIAGMVEKHVEKHVADLVNGRLKADIADMLSIAPKGIKLSEIVSWMRERHEGDSYGEVVTCYVDWKETRGDLWGPECTIFLDEDTHYSHLDREESKLKLEVRHGIKADNGVDSVDLQTGKIEAVYYRGRRIAGYAPSDAGFTFSRPYGVTQRLLALYSAETVIEIDEDDVDVTVGD